MQVTAAGRAASRSSPIGCPHRWHIPYRPASSLCSAASIAVELPPRRVKQRGGVLPLEGEGGSFGVVLVVGPGRARRLGEVGELPFQRRDPLPGRVRSARSNSAWASSRAVAISLTLPPAN